MFNYKCEECGKGVVRETGLEDYKTKIKGRPFVVEKAIVGICDRCGARHFDASETKRWERLYNKKLEANKLYLSAEEIAEVRRDLVLSMESFASLLGCTRQSIYNWEKKDRETPQSRMADLLIKLVRDSAKDGRINVLEFLVEEAANIGTPVRVGNNVNAQSDPIRLEIKRVPRLSLEESNTDMPLAASDEQGTVVVAESNDKTFRGFLRYDFSTANLWLQILHDALCLKAINVTIATNDQNQIDRKNVAIEDNAIPLILETRYRERDIRAIIMEPLAVQAKKC